MKRDDISVLSAGVPVSIPLMRLLLFLIGKVDIGAKAIFFGFLFWLAVVIDNCDFLAGASHDPFDAPELYGPSGRTRRIPVLKKTKVAKMAAGGKVFKSCSAVIKGMKLLKSVKAMSDKDTSHSANKWIVPYAYKYLNATRNVFKMDGVEVPIYHLSWDATTMSRKDSLITAIYHPSLELAAWCPPQVTQFSMLEFSDGS